MTGRCATCKHWLDVFAYDAELVQTFNRRTGQWETMPEYVGWNVCNLITMGEHGADLLKTEMTHGNEAVCTAPDFGCVRWELKDTENESNADAPR